MVWNCIVNIIAAHRLPLNAIQLKFDQNGINFATDATVCWIVMLCVCMVCIYMFVGLLCLILTDTVFVVTVLWIWTNVLQKFLIRHIIPEDCNRKPSYHVDTTQKHYPRIRLPNNGFRVVCIYTGKKSLPWCDEWLDNHTDYYIGLPDVEEVPGNHCICSFVMK